MTGGLTLGAALLLGFAASGHCLVMCGGIAGALGLATAKNANGRPRAPLVIAYQVGRIASYAVAGALVGARWVSSWRGSTSTRCAEACADCPRSRSSSRRWSRSAFCVIQVRGSAVSSGRGWRRSASGSCR
jgi:hypothetical protein